MELFSEIYSCYYSVVKDIVNNAPLTERQMHDYIQEKAFSESTLSILPKLCKNGDWKLLNKEGEHYISILNNKLEVPLSFLEKRWIKSFLFDPRVRLFLDQEVIHSLSEKLNEIPPLYQKEYFRYFDQFLDGDDYSSPIYQEHFRLILSAIREKRVLNVVYADGKGMCTTSPYLLYRVEYSSKNDKFRVFGAKLKGDLKISYGTLNISRIQSISPSDINFTNSIDLEEAFGLKRCTEPITIEISEERNGLERFMLEFANYEKRSEYDENTKKCNVMLWFDQQDEKELLIKLLEFGPVLKIIGPISFLSQIKERVNKQYDLLYCNIT